MQWPVTRCAPPVALIVAAFVLTGAEAAAQHGPEDAARAVFTAFEHGDWEAVAGAVDADAAAKFRGEELALVAAWLEQRDAMRAARRAGATSYGYSSSGVVTPEQVARLGPTPVEAFRGAPSFAELAALAPREFLRRWLESVHGAPPGAAWTNAREARRQVLGAVREGDSLAHVLYRPEGAGVRHEQPWAVEVLALRRTGDTWRVLLPSQDLAWSVDLMHFLHDPNDP